MTMDRDDYFSPSKVATTLNIDFSTMAKIQAARQITPSFTLNGVPYFDAAAVAEFRQALGPGHPLPAPEMKTSSNSPARPSPTNRRRKR